jgi:D-3-phosphoglycerate dehydrogenase
MKVLIPEPIAPSGKDYLRERGYEIADRQLFSAEELKTSIADCDALLIRILACDGTVIRAAEKLKIISKHGVGVDNIDVDYCTRNGIQVTFTPEAVCNAVAEHALFLMFACAKNAALTMRRFAGGGDFQIRHTAQGTELAGKTAGIIGLGRIGRALARKCAGIGMKVTGYDPYVTQEQLGSGIRLAGRESVLQDADFVSMHLPCTAETRGAFGMNEFRLMKKEAFFINSARGGVVREDALIKALEDKIIRGAGIDVFEEEPPSAGNRLLHMDNVFATPHYAGSTRETAAAVSLHAAMGIDEALSGRKVSWPVNHIEGRT